MDDNHDKTCFAFGMLGDIYDHTVNEGKGDHVADYVNVTLCSQQFIALVNMLGIAHANLHGEPVETDDEDWGMMQEVCTVFGAALMKKYPEAVKAIEQEVQEEKDDANPATATPAITLH